MNKQFRNVVIVSFLLVLAAALLDVYGSILWINEGGGWEGAAYVAAGHIYQTVFWAAIYIAVAAIAITYYLIKKDKSEALALLLIPVILLQFGVEDVLFYLLKGLNVLADTMPWLMNKLIPPTVLTNLLHQPVITGPILVISATTGVFLAVYIAKRLEKVKG